MRLWSLHPKYLDAKGLVALWRETLLAQKVLEGKTNGYKNHPQLLRFKAQRNPLGAIGAYLEVICDEATRRGYQFDRSKIKVRLKRPTKMKVNSEQKKYEFEHLLRKLKKRSPDDYVRIRKSKRVALHPLFRSVRGPVENWEVLS